MKTDMSWIERIAAEYKTPAFVFHAEEFERQANRIKEAIGDIPLCFSIKANPFLIHAVPACIRYVEVCSPGELTICQQQQVSPEKIIYSGVNKGIQDIMRAMEYGAAILTAESPLHIQLIRQACQALGKTAKVLLRLTSGNQFGMDPKEAETIIRERSQYGEIEVIGLHYYSGTQKKNAEVIRKDIAGFESLLEQLKANCDYTPSHIEYGPGIAADYFVPPYEKTDSDMLEQVAEAIRDFGLRYPLTVEMGRFLASSCGTYLTSVADIKNNLGTDYVICDGGIHHLKYYGQTMAMQIPPITVLGKEAAEELHPYTLCGSLCTTADLLVRKVELPKLEIGDVLAFGRCGAYTVTEGTVLFLSRTMPRILLYSEKNDITMLRDFFGTDTLNH